ncbi:hypothetical protein LTR36_007249 [Oleoguttula mirabilis]|uniref:DNA helicase n=1 Tax=Oleoguttula mirabilis TaxID=1507867 RepID=A0AAV9JBV0_9PEZI|nr:hypothetical protein LTR36_007249 [Oleoguttula mirabilis]
MRMLDASEAEPATRTQDTHATPTQRDPTTLDHVELPEQHEQPNDDHTNIATNTSIKSEDDVPPSAANATETSLRPDPQPSIKRRESEAAETAQTPELGDKAGKKRKRAVSPPWQFPTVDQSTAKTADGRRISTRVNTGTPVLSESEGGRPRSISHSASRSRPVSPPWKRFEAEGPTTVQIDGKRKSGRMNKDIPQAPHPKRISPRTKKTVDKLSAETKSNVRPASRGKAPQLDGTAETTPRRTIKDERSPSPATRIAQLQAQIAALKPSRSFPTPELEKQTKGTHKRKRSHDAIEQTPRSASPSTARKSQRPSPANLSPEISRPIPRLKLKFSGARQVIPIPHPSARQPSPPRPPQVNLSQLIEEWELKELQLPYMDNDGGTHNAEWFQQRNEKQAADEGLMRRRLLHAQQPGGALSREVCSIFQEQQEEPAPRYVHHDHLAVHALHLRGLQKKERAHHRTLAKKLALEALEYWKLMRGPTEEDLMAEQDKVFRLVYKQVVQDMRAKWEMVLQHVKLLRQEKWELEEEARRQERLQKKLAQAEHMISRQRGVDGGDDVSDSEMDDSETDEEGEQGEEGVGGEEENMSESEESDGDSEGEGDEMSGDVLAAYLAQRDAEPPDKPDEEAGEEEAEVEADGMEPDIERADVPATEANDDTVEPDTDQVEIPATEDLPNSGADGQEDEDEEGQVGYQPDIANADAPSTTGVAETAVGTKSTLARASRRSRRSQSAGATADEKEAEATLSDDESEDMYDSDEDMCSSDDDGEGGGDQASDDDDESSADEQDGADEARNSIYGMLFNGDKIKEFGLPTPTTSAEGDARDRTAEPVEHGGGDVQAEGGAADGGLQGQDETGATVVELQEDSAVVGQEEQPHPSPQLEDKNEVVTTVSEPQEATVVLGHEEQRDVTPQPVNIVAPASAPHSPVPEAPSDAAAKHMVPVPALLRGTLRSYQHAGLDWLASLHRNGTNGILADEMGLGKTIQTISLLAHLAEQHGVWETHLVIVPTSVILNWVTEFQKFLPGFRVLGYYGTSEERQHKRKGWVNDPHHEDRTKRGYNVVITSYNVAMQDINAIRNVQWHYLVLDEAHNIRNFNSQRWQVLIRLKTKARLLLTGTPLQNSLTELWSLLTFLTAGDDDPTHGNLEEFLSHWKAPVKEIFDRGVSALSAAAQKVVDMLHVSLRPFLLRRLKSEVEKDLPKKTESVVVCKLSKRQRQLYQEYMGLASTRDSLAKGNAVSAGKVLLSLRRVCNHPDLFDPRPIQTSFAMERGVVGGFAGKEWVVRRLLGGEAATPPAGMLLAAREGCKQDLVRRSKQIAATGRLREQISAAEKQIVNAQKTSPADIGTLSGSLALRRVGQREKAVQHLRACLRLTEASVAGAPIYGSDLRELVTVRHDRPYTFTQPGRQPVTLLRGWPAFGQRPLKLEHPADWQLANSTALQRDVLAVDKYAENLHDTITRFAFCTPVATAPVLDHAIPPMAQQLLRASDAYPIETDFAHEARARTSIVFPDSRLLVYDSGKLQRLTTLLRDLQAKGSRSLIFTQMTGTLNILEQFLSLLGLPYLRLDGSTPVERRQLYSAEFNRPDSKYQCMILSSRAGGVGLNLTGASSVIFYDLDWNPQMDRQCMDRAHRIGQVRDVEVFKMVSEKTVEENILRRANQKSLLDQAVIQEGHFTTEYNQPAKPANVEEEEDNKDGVAAAIERFLGGGDKATNQAVESVEDKEDVVAAQNARKEEAQDEVDFAERSSKGPSLAATPGPAGAAEVDGDGVGHVDQYMVGLVEAMQKDVLFVPPVVRKLDRHGRDPSHRPKRKR